MLESVTHRHVFTLEEVARVMTGRHGDDYTVRLDDDLLVIDIISKYSDADDAATPPEKPEDDDFPGDAPEPPPAPESASAASSVASDGDQELKGGPLARKAAMLCNEKGFRVFMSAADPDEARERILDKCEIRSRKELDHNDAAAQLFRRIETEYAVWLRGD